MLNYTINHGFSHNLPGVVPEKGCSETEDFFWLLFKGYISEDLMKFSGIFPKKYYREIFRLYNWDYDPISSPHPSCAGTFTNTYVYGMLPPGILTELKNKTVTKASKNSNKKYKATRYYNRLTESGIKEVDMYIDRIIMFMEMCNDIKEFKEKFSKVFKGRLK